VAQVRQIVDEELGFAETTETPRQTAFLCIVNKRVVGMALAEVIETAYLLLSTGAASGATESPDTFGSDQQCTRTGHAAPSNNNNVMSLGLERSKESRKAALGIHLMWVHFNYRNRGIASALVDAARTHMVFGYTVPVDQLAFSSPTYSGVEFARQYHSSRESSQSPPICRTNNNVEVLVYDCGH
jgi:GNAT superfamily N-acetyltransferase